MRRYLSLDRLLRHVAFGSYICGMVDLEKQAVDLRAVKHVL